MDDCGLLFQGKVTHLNEISLVKGAVFSKQPTRDRTRRIQLPGRDEEV